ncbi:tRNA-splicing endonuclease subunit [Coemansia sp. RSA 2599]|nr:tRNA-splicing endonuclease subunit [Coemansia sp. RSA 2598]KAJ1812974.1 tRNA-splicing endonuclease subunit [Coemansia sp. RSA 2599]
MEEEAREYKVQWSESGQAVIFDADTVMRLRKDHRIVGALEGSHPIKPLQNLYFGLPLILLPEETALLVETGVITPDPGISLPWPSTSREKVLFALYKDMHKRGYYITRGLKFGGEYLLYPGK